MKHSFYILLLLFVSIFSIDARADIFVKISSVNELSDGDKVILVSQNYLKQLVAISTSQETNYRKPVVVSEANGVICNPQDEVQVFTILKSSDNTFKFDTGSGYLYYPADNKNSLKTISYSDEKKLATKWTISKSEKIVYDENEFVIRNVSVPQYYIQLYSDQNINRFSCYAVNRDILIYKRISNSDSEGNDLYVRNTRQNSYVTLCYPFDADINGIAYSIVGKTDSSILLFKQSEIKAGMPYIVYVEGSELSATFSGEMAELPLSDNGLIGSYMSCPVDEGKYLLSNNTIKKCGTGCSIREFRAYIDMDQVPTFNQAREKGMIEISGDGVVDFINSINEDSAGSDYIFNLNGVRTNTLTRGLNIIKQSNGTVKKLYKK